MEISQHIKNLLKTNERVILSGFGTFITKQISAQIDKETKVMKPPFKIVVFDQDIIKDAGLLVKYMAEQEQITLDNAREQVEEYIKTVKSKLAAGKSVEFKDLGSFKQSAAGKFEFSFLTEDNLLLDSFGLPSVTISEQGKVSTPPVEKKIPIEKKPPIEKTPPKKPVTKERPPVKKTPPIKREKPVKTKSTSDKPKKKRKWLVLVIIIAVIGVMLAAVYFFKPDLWNKGYSFSVTKLTVAKEKIAGLFKGDDSGKYDVIEEVVIDTDTSSTEDEVISDENEDETYNEDETDTDINETTDNNEVVDVTINEDTSSGQSGRYYIIVASVKSQSSAQKEQQRFTDKGISTDIIHVPHMDRYRISIGDFGSAKKAQDFFANFQSKHSNIDAWVWEKK